MVVVVVVVVVAVVLVVVTVIVVAVITILQREGKKEDTPYNHVFENYRRDFLLTIQTETLRHSIESFPVLFRWCIEIETISRFFFT